MIEQVVTLTELKSCYSMHMRTSWYVNSALPYQGQPLSSEESSLKEFFYSKWTIEPAVLQILNSM